MEALGKRLKQLLVPKRPWEIRIPHHACEESILWLPEAL
jgi:hypothetical protein